MKKNISLLIVLVAAALFGCYLAKKSSEQAVRTPTPAIQPQAIEPVPANKTTRLHFAGLTVSPKFKE